MKNQVYKSFSWTLLSVFLITVTREVTSSECPDGEDIQPCTCYVNDEGMVITCSKVSLYELVRTFDRLRGIQIQKVIFYDPQIPYIPEGVFRQTNLSHLLLHTVNMSSFKGPKPNKSPFIGVEDTLHTIELSWPNEGKGNFNWSDLTVLRNLKELRVLGLHIPTVQRFPPLNALIILTLQHTETATLADDAFVDLPNLERINIQDNLLTTLQRSMFAPRSKLQRINLSANKLVNVPTDMFTDMPDLEILTIAYNQIKNLPVQPFQINKQLTLDFTGNRIFCTCDLKWMRDKAKEGRLRFQGDCHNVRIQNAKNILTFFKKCK